MHPCSVLVLKQVSREASATFLGNGNQLWQRRMHANAIGVSSFAPRPNTDLHGLSMLEMISLAPSTRDRKVDPAYPNAS
jgi:hypothetical protein